jgi:DNA-directed RNA polymerase subunit K/omega
MSKEQNLSLEAVYAKGVSTFSAVMMTAYEARFINEQANLGFIELKEKPTTIAIQKFKEDKLKIINDKKDGEEVVQPE